MRIIGGNLRGRTINPPDNFKARPTTDFAKEGLFNILENEFDFEELSVLDLFSGTGSISYEFASRGCNKITSVEMNPNHFKFIKDNSSILKFEGIQVLRLNAFDFIQICKIKYDIIFADPPFDIVGLAGIPTKILEKNILNLGGYLIMEHPSNLDFSKESRFYKKKNYGNVHFSFFK